MISNKSIETIFAEIDIEEIISQYISLEQKGNTLWGCCPFHEEKSASFAVNKGKGLFKCFGCGESGNAFQFVQKFNKLSSYETFVELAKLMQINLEFVEEDKDQKEKRAKMNNLYDINKYAADYYHKALLINQDALQILSYRNVNINDIKSWNLGFCDRSNPIANVLKENGQSTEGKSIGIIRENNGSTYDAYYNRITIPIIDIKGNVVGFGAKGGEPKYLNSSDSDIYNKGNTLFGLFQNQESIRKKRKAYITEGYFDVISISRAGLNNTVASCGTAFTDGQAKLLKKHTSTAILFYDNDNAGITAAKKTLEILLRFSFNVQIVINIPANFDPDDYVRDFEANFENATENYNILNDRINENTVDALTYISEQIYNANDSAFEKGEAINEIAKLISDIPNITTKSEYIKEVSKALKINRSDLKKEVENIDKNKIKTLDTKTKFEITDDYGPTTEDAMLDFRKYGFWADERFQYFGYHFGTKDGPKKVSNFILDSLYLIATNNNNSNDASRIFKIQNELNIQRIIELPIDALTSLSKFQTNVEKLGKFIFEGSQTQINRLKHKLYSEEKHCIKIRNLGWQKPGFWAFGNGIFTDEFQDIDTHGIVLHKDQFYFIPVLSTIYQNDDDYLKNDKKFVHKKTSKIKFKEWSKLYTEVYNYGSHFNGTLAILYLCAALFRDVIYKENGNFFPLLFLFGPPGTGKNQFTYSILNVFGTPQDLVNLNSTTKAGITKRMAEYYNSLIFLDEYNNSLPDDVIQFLKSVADGTSRTKSEITTDDKTTSTSVRSSAIVAGQEKPISSGGALFSRCVFLQFKERNFDHKKYNSLIEEERKNGITSILLEIIQYRHHVEIEFKKQFESARKKMETLISNYNNEQSKLHRAKVKFMDRIINSYSVLLGVFYTLKTELRFPFQQEDIEPILFGHMLEQNRMVNTTNDVAIFWEYLQSLVMSIGLNRIEEGKHFKFKNEIINEENIVVLYLQFSSVYPLYQKEYRQTENKPAIDKSSMTDYLKNSEEYLGYKASTSFNRDGKRFDNSAMMFNYTKLSKKINLIIKSDYEENTPYKSMPVAKKEDNNLFNNTNDIF